MGENDEERPFQVGDAVHARMESETRDMLRYQKGVYRETRFDEKREYYPARIKSLEREGVEDIFIVEWDEDDVGYTTLTCVCRNLTLLRPCAAPGRPSRKRQTSSLQS